MNPRIRTTRVTDERVHIIRKISPDKEITQNKEKFPTTKMNKVGRSNSGDGGKGLDGEHTKKDAERGRLKLLLLDSGERESGGERERGGKHPEEYRELS